MRSEADPTPGLDPQGFRSPFWWLPTHGWARHLAVLFEGLPDSPRPQGSALYLAANIQGPWALLSEAIQRGLSEGDLPANSGRNGPHRRT